MKDLYLKATSKQQVLDLLAVKGLTMESDYFENEDFVIDWIGKVPKVINEGTGEVESWFTDFRFNVRLIDESDDSFDGFVNVYPETPYRVFS